MVQLYINDKLAVLKTGFNSVLTRNNPFFTDSGDYTFDIALPLDGCAANQKIFGSLHRIESSLAKFVGQKYDFRLMVPPMVLTGKAIIKNITEEEVRVQLLAGASALNIDMLEDIGKDIYIDEMNLGKAYENTYPDAYAKGDRFEFEGQMISPRSILLEKLYYDKDRRKQFGLNSETECVNYAIWSDADQAKGNNKQLSHFAYDGQPVTDEMTPNLHNHVSEPYFAAQPFLINIVERVIEQLGYTVSSNSVRGTWMENIFIANVKNEYYYNRILPHWTVNEFLKEVRNFFGVFFKVEGTMVDIVSKSDYYQKMDDTVVLSAVVDEHSTDINEDDDINDTSAANVGYDWPADDDMLQLPEEVWENAIIIKKPNEQILNTWIQQHIPEADREKSAWVFVDEETSRCFAYLSAADDNQYHWVQVDCCPPLIRRGEQFGPTKRDIDIALRIVPAKMSFHNIDYQIYKTGGTQNFDKAVSLPMLQSDYTREGLLNIFSVDAAINGAAQQENTENDLTCIEVAVSTGETFRTSFKAGGQDYNIDVPMAIGVGYVQWADGLYHKVISAGNQDQFVLTNKKAPSLQDSVLNPRFRIDTRCVHIFTFVDDIIISPTDTFIIRGKKYACQKVEYTLDDRGINKLKRGYFFEINPQ